MWFYDDLHCPNPISPLYFDVGGWWDTEGRWGSDCTYMYQRFGTPIGKGMIGISLAALFTGNGIPTVVLAKNQEAGLEKYRTYYKDLIAQGLVTQRQAAACERLLSFTEDYAGLREAELVFECVTEDLEVKHGVYRQAEAACPWLRAIASTTSAISPADLARGMGQKENIMMAHPYNPPSASSPTGCSTRCIGRRCTWWSRASAPRRTLTSASVPAPPSACLATSTMPGWT